MGLMMTVGDLAFMWQSAAEGMRNGNPVTQEDHILNARADQLEACAVDLMNTKFHHELIQDAESKKKSFRRIR